MKRACAFCILSTLAVHADTPDFTALAKLKTAALVVRATASVSCGDGSEGTCVRKDPEVVKRVTAIVEGTELWERFTRADATKADAVLEFTLKNADTTYGTIYFAVRDADSNKTLYYEWRDVVTLENDITRIVSHFLKAAADAKKNPAGKTKP